MATKGLGQQFLDGELQIGEPPKGVVIAVRVRPLWKKGREANSQCIVSMSGNQTNVTDPTGADPVRSFAFDHSYWSADGFKSNADGVLEKDSPTSPYASQEQVWRDLGKIVLTNALGGYNCTLFAYGQTGAGKSYSVVGYPPNDGIIPKCLTELFHIIQANKDPNVRWTCEIAMLEIYLEEVFDLLDPPPKDGQKRKELDVDIIGNQVTIWNKDSKNKDSIWRACSTKQQADAFREAGEKNRTVRATGMNATSSRGHTVFIIRFSKLVQNKGAWTAAFRSKINLVDLAGSERPADTGLSGLGLEEGKFINSSLSGLGRVMKDLADGKRPTYRGMRLCEVLSESLNGQAVTIMIAALSPADLNYNDTVSTLRFADNAKKMKISAVKQLNPTEQLIADLKAENEKLKILMSKAGGAGGATGGADPEAVKKLQAEADAKIAEEEKAKQAAQKAAEEAQKRATEMENLQKQAAADAAAAKADAEKRSKELEELEKRLASATGPEKEALREAAEESKKKAAEAEAQAKAAQEASQKQIALIQEQLDAMKKEADAKVAALEKQHAETQAAKKKAEDEAQIMRMKMMDMETLRKEEAKKAEETQKALLKQQQDAEAAAKKAAADAEIKNAEVQQLKAKSAADIEAAKKDADAKAKALQELQIKLAAATGPEKEALEKDAQAAKDAAAAAEAKAKAAKDAADAQIAQMRAEREAAKRDADAKLAEADARARAVDEAKRKAEEDARLMKMQVGDLQNRQKALEMMLADAQTSYEDKLKKTEEQAKKLQDAMQDMGLSVKEFASAFGGDGGLDDNDPFLVNIADDPLDSGALIYGIPNGETKIKRLGGDKSTERAIKLDGASIAVTHAILTNDDKAQKHYIQPVDSAVVFVNGTAVKNTEKLQLQHGDRIVLGNEFAFKFLIPSKGGEKNKTVLNPGEVFDFKRAMAEVAKKAGMDIDAEVQKASNKLQEHYQKEADEMKKKQQQLERELQNEKDEKVREAKRKELEALLKEQQEAIDALNGRSNKGGQLQLDVERARQQMADLQPLVMEANRISKAIQRGVEYSFKMVDVPPVMPSAEDGDVDLNAPLEPRRVMVRIRVLNKELNEKKMWTEETLRKQFELMKPYANLSGKQQIDEDRDPFWPLEDHMLVASGNVPLKNLSEWKSVRVNGLEVKDTEGNVMGQLDFTVRCVTKKGDKYEPPKVAGPLRVVLFGPPGSGRATQGGLLNEKFAVVEISAGDLCRDEAMKNTPQAAEIKKAVDSGMLVPDETVISLVKNKMNEPSVKEKGWMFVGFPRTPEQAERMFLSSDKDELPDLICILNVPYNVLRSRIVNRRVDPVTRKVYNLLKDKISPEIKARLVQRADDKEEVLKVKYEQYMTALDGCKAVFARLPDTCFTQVVEIDAGQGTPEDVCARIVEKIDAIQADWPTIRNMPGKSYMRLEVTADKLRGFHSALSEVMVAHSFYREPDATQYSFTKDMTKADANGKPFYQKVFELGRCNADFGHWIKGGTMIVQVRTFDKEAGRVALQAAAEKDRLAMLMETEGWKARDPEVASLQEKLAQLQRELQQQQAALQQTKQEAEGAKAREAALNKEKEEYIAAQKKKSSACAIM